MSKIIIISIITVALAIGIGAWFVKANNTSQAPIKGQVYIMYAGSLVNPFETMIGPSFQNDSGYTYLGEGKGSVQLANMIINKQRYPDVFVSAGTIPIMKLVDHKPPFANWLV